MGTWKNQPSNFNAKFDKQDTKFDRKHEELINVTAILLCLTEDTRSLKKENKIFSSKIYEHMNTLT